MGRLMMLLLLSACSPELVPAFEADTDWHDTDDSDTDGGW